MVVPSLDVMIAGPETELRMSDADRVWTFVLLAGGGAALLLVLPWLLDLVSGFPWVPFEDVARWVAGFDAPWAWAARLAAGAAVGGALAVLTIVDEHRVVVRDEELVLVHGRDRRTAARDQVVGVYLDGRRLVVDGTQGRRLFHERLEAPRHQVREAFLAHAYPWESA